MTATVGLTEEQQGKVRDVYLKGEATQKDTWQKFNQAQMSAIAVEAEMFAAMQDRMTEPQLQKFTTGRKSQQTKISAGTYTSATPHNALETSDRTDKAGSSKDIGSKRTEEKQTGGIPAKSNQSASISPSECFVQDVIIVPMNEVLVAIGMNSAEQAKCISACRPYHVKLNKAWHEIHQLRNELVMQESKSIEAVEKILTKDQLTKLKQHRVSVAESGNTVPSVKASSIDR